MYTNSNFNPYLPSAAIVLRFAVFCISRPISIQFCPFQVPHTLVNGLWGVYDEFQNNIWGRSDSIAHTVVKVWSAENCVFGVRASICQFLHNSVSSHSSFVIPSAPYPCEWSLGCILWVSELYLWCKLFYSLHRGADLAGGNFRFRQRGCNLSFLCIT